MKLSGDFQTNRKKNCVVILIFVCILIRIIGNRFVLLFFGSWIDKLTIDDWFYFYFCFVFFGNICQQNVNARNEIKLIFEWHGSHPIVYSTVWCVIQCEREISIYSKNPKLSVYWNELGQKTIVYFQKFMFSFNFPSVVRIFL